MLSMVMEKTQAWEQLNDPQYCAQLTTEGMYRLMLRAGYSQTEAQQAANRRGHERLDAGVAV